MLRRMFVSLLQKAHLNPPHRTDSGSQHHQLREAIGWDDDLPTEEIAILDNLESFVQ